MFPVIKIYHIKDSKTREETVRSWPYSFRENDLNIEKFTPPTTTTTTTTPEKQYICLTSASQARQKCFL